MTSPGATENPRQTLLRELCEQINLWDQFAVIDDEDSLAEHWLLPVIDRYVARLTDPGVRYLGYEVNGEQVEVLLGDKFETHIVTANEVKYRIDGREHTVHIGDWVTKDGVVRTADQDDIEGPW